MAAAAHFEIGEHVEGLGYLPARSTGRTSSKLTPSQQRRQQTRDAAGRRRELQKQQRVATRKASRIGRAADKSAAMADKAAAKGDQRMAAIHSRAALEGHQTAGMLHASAANLGQHVNDARLDEQNKKSEMAEGARAEAEGRAFQRRRKTTEKQLQRAAQAQQRVARTQYLAPGYSGQIVTESGNPPGLLHKLTGRSWKRAFAKGGRTNRRRRTRRRTKHRRRRTRRRTKHRRRRTRRTKHRRRRRTRR